MFQKLKAQPTAMNPAPSLRRSHGHPFDNWPPVGTGSWVTYRRYRLAYTSLETSQQFFPMKVSADENDPGVSFLVRFPSPIGDTSKQHVDTLENAALCAPLEIEDAFHPKNVRAFFAEDFTNPSIESVKV